MMDTVAISTGTKVDMLNVPILKLLIRVKLFSRLEPLVTGPSLPHWKMARMISAKPSVAMAR